MSENINFSNNLTLTKVGDLDTLEVIFDITDTEGLIISSPTSAPNPAVTISGDLDITGDLNIQGNTVVNEDTKLSITDKNVLMNVPQEPVAPSGTSEFAGGIVTSAVVTNGGVNFTSNELVPVVFDSSGGVTATGDVQADVSGVVAAGTPVINLVGGDSYVVAPDFTFGNPAETPTGNKPVRATVNADSSGTIVIRDWFDGTEGHAGIIWDESGQAWDFNSPIPQDVYESDPIGLDNTLPANPVLKNIGAPVDPADAVDFATLTAWTLTDLFDVDTTGEVTGKVLRFTDGLGWLADDIEITDIGGISPPPTESGYFYWDHTLNGGTGEFIFVENIAATDVTGLSSVAISGQDLLANMGDVTAAPTEGEVLTYESGEWVTTPKSGNGDITKIQDLTVSPTAVVETVATNISMTADGALTMNIDGTTSIGSENINLNAGSALSFTAADAILFNSHGNVASTEATLYALGDMIITSTTGEVKLHNVAYPPATGGTADGSYLAYDSSGTMVWTTLATSATQARIENALQTTFVDTENQHDTVVIQAPDLGDISNGGGNITNPVGVVIEPGVDRMVEIPGASTSVISSDTGMTIQTTGGDISITPTGVAKISEYTFPNELTSRAAGDFLIIDPLDTVNKQNLIFAALSLDFNSDVTLSSPTEFDVLVRNGAGIFVNRRMQYSDIDPSGAPSINASILDLNDTHNPADDIPAPISVPAELQNRYLRWDPAGTVVIYEETISGANVNLTTVVTDIIPTVTNTNTVGNASKVFKEVHSTDVFAGTLHGAYTNELLSVEEGMLSTAVQSKLNASAGVGDAVLANDQTFLGQNTFAPTDPASGFVVSTVDGSILLSAIDGDVDITSTNGDVNVSGYQRAMDISMHVTNVVGGTGTVTVNFAKILPDNAIITTCRILVVTQFDGNNPTLEVGNLNATAGIMESSESDISVIGKLNHVNRFKDVTNVVNEKQLTATLTLDSATIGEARILVEYYVL